VRDLNDLNGTNNSGSGGAGDSRASSLDLTDGESRLVDVGFVSDGWLGVLLVRVQPAIRDGVAILAGLLLLPRVDLVRGAIGMLVVWIAGLLVLVLGWVAAGGLVTILSLGIVVVVVTIMLMTIRRSSAARVSGGGVVATVVAGSRDGGCHGKGERFHLFLFFVKAT